MQRTLVMIRHAKSSWANFSESDFDRPLNERGEHDGPMMGRRLKKLGLKPDLIIASTAKRAKQTAKLIATALDYDVHNIQWEEKLYHCGPPEFEEVINVVNDKIITVFIIAHNPGITEFVNRLSSGFKTDHLPTCGTVAARADATHWNEFLISKPNVFLFEYPKKQP